MELIDGGCPGRGFYVEAKQGKCESTNKFQTTSKSRDQRDSAKEKGNAEPIAGRSKAGFVMAEYWFVRGTQSVGWCQHGCPEWPSRKIRQDVGRRGRCQ